MAEQTDGDRENEALDAMIASFHVLGDGDAQVPLDDPAILSEADREALDALGDGLVDRLLDGAGAMDRHVSPVSPRPWSTRPDSTDRIFRIVDADGTLRFLGWHSMRQTNTRDIPHAIACVNLLNGFDPSSPRLAALLGALRGRDEDELGVVMDRLEEVRLIGANE